MIKADRLAGASQIDLGVGYGYFTLSFGIQLANPPSQ
jgi:hypothetical protein